MAVREDGHVAVGGRQLGDQRREAPLDLVEGLGTRRRVGPDRPAGVALAELLGRQALGLAVVELDELGSCSAASPRPARRQVSTARPSGLTSTFAKPRPSSRGRSAVAWRLPSSVSDTSVRPVWRRSRLHSVSPWRASTISGLVTGAVLRRRAPPRPSPRPRRGAGVGSTAPRELGHGGVALAHVADVPLHSVGRPLGVSALDRGEDPFDVGKRRDPQPPVGRDHAASQQRSSPSRSSVSLSTMLPLVAATRV